MSNQKRTLIINIVSDHVKGEQGARLEDPLGIYCNKDEKSKCKGIKTALGRMASSAHRTLMHVSIRFKVFEDHS